MTPNKIPVRVTPGNIAFFVGDPYSNPLSTGARQISEPSAL